MTPEEAAKYLELILETFNASGDCAEAYRMGAAALRRQEKLEARIEELESELYAHMELYQRGF